MTLQFYNNNSDIRVLNKSLTAIGSEVTASFTDVVNYDDPLLKLDMDASLVGANYFYVKEWGKYYYIRNKDIIDGNFLYITGHMDVLMSFKSAILNSQVIAQRSGSSANAYIVDDCVGDKGTIKQYFRKSSTTPFSTQTKCYVLSIAGK